MIIFLKNFSVVCRPLKVDDVLLINDYIYIQLFNTNIWSTIMKIIKSICDKCSKKSDNCKNHNGFYTYCESCVENLIDININHIVIKEEYGKSIFSF